MHSVVVLFSVAAAAGGVYLNSREITDRTNPQYAFSIGRIVHPVGFTSAGGGELVVKVCVDSTPENAILVGPAQRAVASWAARTPITGNYSRNGGEGRPDAQTVLTHELGHCAMGLDHSDHDSYLLYTASLGDTAQPGDPDGIPGSSDDVHLPQIPPTSRPDNLHYFRIVDNNPFAIDSVVIDTNSYRRAATPTNLPAGHSWAVLGNFLVAEFSLGVPNSQDIMISSGSDAERYRGLIADNVSMVSLGEAGLDGLAGTTDDYTVRVEYQDNCTGAHVRVQFADLMGAGYGRCSALTQVVSDRHYRVVPLPGLPLIVELERDLNWEFGAEVPLFFDPFESGDTSAWDVRVPP